jgi:hypothetical protein
MRHALVVTKLMDQARTAATAEADDRRSRRPSATVDAEPDPAPEPRRLTTLARRARTLRLRAQTPGGGA